LVLLLLVFFAQAVTSIPLKAPTFDEEFHIARAYAYVRTDDLRMQQNHPPLVSLLAGLPLLLMPELTPPEEIPHWDDAFLFHFADNLFWRLGHDVDKMLFLARFPIILLGTLLGAFVCRWAREAHGTVAGFLAVGLYAFAPNLLAHTRLVTTDLAVTACSFIALYAFWRYLRRPTGWRLGLAGLALGLALAAKLSALLLIPVMGVLILLESGRIANCRLRIADRGERIAHRRRWAFRSLSFAICRLSFVICVACLVIWALYRFEVRPWPGTGLPLPATTYLLNVRTLIGHAGRGHGAFLMGQVSTHGWWYYFPVAFLLKTPSLMLLLLGVAAWDTVRRRRWRAELPFLLFPMAYFGFALASSLNIGYRYILPILPFVIVYAAKVAGLTWLRPAWLRHYALPVLAVLYAGASLWLHPHYLAYFNLLAGGPEGGYRYLVDSNLDWGQDLKLLKTYLDEQGVGEVWLGYLGTADPAYYGLRYRSLFAPGSSNPAEDFSPLNPTPEWYAISATVLQGAYSPEPDLLDWFRRREPVAKVGYSIFVYRVEPDPDPPTWLGVCYAPQPVMGDAEIAHRFGRDDLRVVGFDCGQTWVYPAGDGAGWYLVPAASDGSGTLAELLLGDAEVIYRERGLRDVRGYTVYRWRGEPARGGPALEELAPIREAWASPALVPDDDPVTPLPVPADVGGQLVFLGYRLSSEHVAPGDEVVLTTVWRVTAQPEAPPLSVFAHLVGPTGAASVGDGLGFPAIQWSPGDVFVQRSRLSVPPETVPGRYWVEVGLYSLADGERLPVLEAGEPVADRLLLAIVWIGDADDG
jgi:4-amino-4-deoxy-L-arabinose transferase-like glycosyltransferase